MLRLVERCAELLFALPPDRLTRLLCDEVAFDLAAAAQTRGVAVEALSSTLAFAVCHKKSGRLLLFSLGDSAIVSRRPNGGELICRPEAGRRETVTTTTRGCHTAAVLIRRPIEEDETILLLTDGAWEVLSHRLPTAEPQALHEALAAASPTDDAAFIAANFNR